MTEKMWYEKTWDEMNQVRLVKLIKQWSDMYDYSDWQPSEEEILQYQKMYERANSKESGKIGLSDCVYPERFGKYLIKC